MSSVLASTIYPTILTISPVPDGIVVLQRPANESFRYRISPALPDILNPRLTNPLRRIALPAAPSSETPSKSDAVVLPLLA